MTRFKGLGYSTKRIHSINIRGKNLRNIFLKVFSGATQTSGIAVVSVELLVLLEGFNTHHPFLVPMKLVSQPHKQVLRYLVNFVIITTSPLLDFCPLEKLCFFRCPELRYNQARPFLKKEQRTFLGMTH